MKKLGDNLYMLDEKDFEEMDKAFPPKKYKDCPFCGGNAHIDDSWPHRIFCEKCGAEIRSTLMGEDGIKACIEAWNRRDNG